MAEASVNLLLMKLQQEEKLLGSLQADVEYIGNELQFMKAFLRAADSMENTDTDLKIWVKKVTEIAHDLEDAVEEFRLLVAHNGDRRIFQFISISRARIRIARKMQEIKSRVIYISEQHRRYIIKNNLIVGESLSSSGAILSLPRKGEGSFVIEEPNLVGIGRHKQNLMEFLVNGRSDREVVSVVGVGGLGKTTLVKEVYNDAEVKQQFKFRAWITVSQTRKVEELLKDLIHQLFYVLYKADPLVVDTMAKDKIQLIKVINEFLLQRRYLIVLDDVWNTNVLNAFEGVLPDNNYGSRILLTTRNSTVANCTISLVNVYLLNPLSNHDSWTLFCNKVFHKSSCPPHLKAVSREIIARCRGLPLAIAAVSGVLAAKGKSKIDELEMILCALHDHDDEITSVMKAISLGYNDLPYYLKSCLLYLSIFPVGHPIKRGRLIRLWVLEGFVNERGAMALEQVAESYLNELISRSLVQVTETTIDGRVKSCRLHDLIYQTLIPKAKYQNFMMIVKKESKMWLEKARRLSIQNAAPNIQQQFATGIRSVLMFSGVGSLSDSAILKLPFDRLQLLNVLDLEGTPLKEFPKQIVKLRLLKYLSLRNTKVKTIPRSIQNLQNLETLDLKHACVTELPTEILKLRKLRHLLVYRYEISPDDKIHIKYGVKAPTQIASLQSLQKLCFIEADNSRLMQELGKLNNLRRLGITKLRKETGKNLCSSIEKLINLHALSVTAISEKDTIDLEDICFPPQCLQRLYLAGKLEKLPDWISSLDCLVKVVLKWSQLRDDPLLSLQNLPKLVYLELIQAYDGREFFLQSQGFQSLKFLGLTSLEQLQLISVEVGAMPHLEKLIIQSCYSMVSLPSGIQNLGELKVLEFINMPIELIMKMDPNGGHGDHWNVEHVPEVHFSYSTNGNWDIFSLNHSRRHNNSGYGKDNLMSKKVDSSYF